MLTSIIYKRLIKYDEKTKLSTYEYEITDDELGVHLIEGGYGTGAVAHGSAIIKFYEERNLNVAYNLFRAFIYHNNKFGHSLEDISYWNLKYNPKYPSYHNEVQKYLMLL